MEKMEGRGNEGEIGNISGAPKQTDQFCHFSLATILKQVRKTSGYFYFLVHDILRKRIHPDTEKINNLKKY